MEKQHIVKNILHYFNLDSEVDDYGRIHEAIVRDIAFKGTNLWILIFAIIVASVGLNMNSTAVIIGAMLISPLMGPINGMGYSIATYNFPLFRQALKNFSFAVGTSLVTSTAYFALSPISTAHSELLARTSPTIYDVLIALFGGLAGIVAISSKQKGNVIPGVAIATALMPPLCTAGYGLATAQFYYFFGAFYLFAINTVFIALSAVAVSQLLKFPITTIVGTRHKKRVNQGITFVIMLIIVPSIYFGFNLVKKERFTENANKYIKNISFVEGNYLLEHEINSEKNTISLVYGGESMTDKQVNAIKEKANGFDLSNAEIVFRQGFSFDAISEKNLEVDGLKTELNRLKMLLQDRDRQLLSGTKNQLLGKQILDEINSLYPQIVTCFYAETQVFDTSTNEGKPMSVVIFTVTDNNFARADKEKIRNWLLAKLKTEQLKVYYEKQS